MKTETTDIMSRQKAQNNVFFNKDSKHFLNQN
jgi:hypothetical protein